MSDKFNVGIATESKPSSRVLKPPGGGHSDIFGPPLEKVRAPRPKNDQQDSSMMFEITGRKADEAAAKKEASFAPEPGAAPTAPVDVPKSGEQARAFESKAAPAPASDNGRVRVPPGGFSSGLW